MPLRFLKDKDGREIFGHNKKKLRYEINDGNITLKYAKNWTDNAKKILVQCYENCEIISETKSRGRPKVKSKKITRKNRESLRRSAATMDSDDDIIDNFMNFKVGMRVKSREMPNLGIGLITKLEKYTHNGKTYYNAYVDFEEEKGEIFSVDLIIKARGRKPNKSKNMELKKEKVSAKKEISYENEDVDFDILKIDGEIYLINKQNDVMTLSGEYIGWYNNNKII